jgi:hypothetical protein
MSMLLDSDHSQYGPGSRTANQCGSTTLDFLSQICCTCQVTNLVSGKLALRYSGPALDAMKAVALAAKARSLADFQVQLFAHIDQLRFGYGDTGPRSFPGLESDRKTGPWYRNDKI